ncbi:hypothetical protein BCR36DRAFT_580778 [Piromyces finnis]|uniref:Uncharacterized protein n=1 Tax=Piromyces finnis TaxID=1754191 RepID=A0A1Y1VHI0_9FUNG|nr:hypothetical protein BCR36DRAFT_580778 [Piromyces finnis]|eukprot:ORX56473.1 hypothetical protein BCR36DRAFT_580778 [Piromyces finnis]
MAYSMQWQDLSLKQINQFYDTVIQQNAISLIESWFPSDDSANKKRILYDFYYFILMFAKEIHLEPIQTSIFFSIMKKTHENCISSPYMKLDEDYALFQKLILDHSIDRPPFSKKYFTLDQITKITDYATNTYFRHYSMYKYTFTKQQKLTLNTVEIVKNLNTKEEDKDEQVIDSEEGNQQNDENIDSSDGTNNETINIVEIDKNIDKKDSSKEIEDIKDKIEEENITEQNNSNITTENNINSENATNQISSENENVDEESKEQNEEKLEEISPREKAIQELKILIENAISPKIQELKVSLTTMLTNSEDQLIKQIKKMDDAKKKAVKDATAVKKDAKGDKGKDDKKKSAKGKKK